MEQDVTMVTGSSNNGNGRPTSLAPTVPPLVRDLMGRADSLATRLMQMGEQFGEFYAEERAAFASLQAASSFLDDELSGGMADAVTEATVLKTGPLAGIATTSKAYDVAVKGLRTSLLRGSLDNLQRDVDSASVAHMNAAIQLKSFEVELGACKAAGEILAALLRIHGR